MDVVDAAICLVVIAMLLFTFNSRFRRWVMWVPFEQRGFRETALRCR